MKEMFSITSLAAALRSGEISDFELISQCLSNIEQKDKEIGAFLTVLKENAIKQALAFDNLKDDNKWESPLAGIPFAVKDNLCLAGFSMTCGSKMLSDFIAPYDATVLQKLKSCGAIPIGKTNMDEFGMGSTTEYSAFGPTRNPVARDRVPGGSSGGSAAAVAGGMVPFSLGSDTGGSVRLPAAYCGLVGLRPTYGAVSRYGLTAFCSSMDTVGPMTYTVQDNQLVYRAIMGNDPKDATSKENPFSQKEMPNTLRVGIISRLMGEKIAPAAKENVQRAANYLESLGHTVKMIEIPSLEDSLVAYFIISSAEASSNLARFDGVRYGYRQTALADIESLYTKSRNEGLGEEVKRRIRLGSYALSRENRDAYYERSLACRMRLCGEFSEIFTDFDVLLCPTAPDVAPKLGQLGSATEMYGIDLCTVAPALAGLPALSIPFSKDENGLPLGLQLVGDAFSEELLYHVGMLLEGGVDR